MFDGRCGLLLAWNRELPCLHEGPFGLELTSIVTVKVVCGSEFPLAWFRCRPLRE